MNDANLESGGAIQFNLGDLIRLLIRKSRQLLLISLLGAVLALLIVFFFVPPQYQSSVMFYVNNTSVPVDDTSVSVSSGDLFTARNLVDSYIVVLKIRESLLEVIDHAGVNISVLELEDMITASAVNNTEFFQVFVTSPDPNEAEKIANAIGYVLPGQIARIIEGTSASVVENAVAAIKPCSPGYVYYALLGLGISLMVSVVVLILQELLGIAASGPRERPQTETAVLEE